MEKEKVADRYWSILQNNIEWLKFSETKATLILTLYGLILTILYTNSKEVLESVRKSNWILFLLIISAATSILSIVYAFLVVNPRLNNINPNSIIYFGHIQKKYVTCKSYKESADKVLENEGQFTDQIAEQIHSISKIAWKKYTYFAYSFRLFVCSLSMLLVAVVMYLFSCI